MQLARQFGGIPEPLRRPLKGRLLIIKPCRLLVVPYFGCDYRVGADFFGRCAFKSDRCVAAATCGGADSRSFRGSRGLLRRRVTFPPGMDESPD